MQDFDQTPNKILVSTVDEEVHLHFGAPDTPAVVVKLKSPEAVDVLIDALQEHRKKIWGEPSLTSWIKREQAKRATPEARARFDTALAAVQAIFKEEEERAKGT